jgi:O-antigen ligase
MVSLKNFATTRKAVRLFLRGSGCYYLSWLLLLVSPFLFTARTAKEVLDGTLNTANLLRLSVLTIACILLFNKTLIIKTIIKRNSITVYFLFSMFAIGSALWSVALTPTLGKSGELFLGTFLVFLVVNNENCKLAYRILNKILETTLLILTLVLQLMVVGFFVAPSTFAAPSTGFFQWRLGMENVFISANGVAYLGAILAANALGNIVYPSDKGKFRKKKWYLSIYCLGWLSIILAQGRTGAAALLIVSILILFQKRNTLILLLITALPVSFISSRMVEQFFVRNESIELLTSLTGRTILWEHAWFAFLEKPLFGYGFGVASRFVFSLGISGFSETISSIHNAYIE